MAASASPEKTVPAKKSSLTHAIPFAKNHLGIGALVAALVASLAGTWGLSEVLGWRHSLNEKLSHKNAKFYAAYAMVHVIGALIVLANVDLVNLVIDVEVMNALLLPVVVGFLLVLEAKVLPRPYRIRGAYRFFATLLCLAVMGFALYTIPVVL